MKKVVEEENKAKKHRLMARGPDWLDLPEATATNIILENLDVVDYIRFPAVCRRWQSIQKEHRIRYSPSPPPSPLSLPWLLCNHCLVSLDNVAFHFYLPDKRKTYSIPPWKGFYRIQSCSHAYGWLLLLVLNFDPCYQCLCIVNPITGVQIVLRLSRLMYYARMTSPPTDPDCTVLTFDVDDRVHLYRLNQNGAAFCKSDFSIINGCRPFFCHGRIYFMVQSMKIFMVDGLLTSPAYKTIEMDCSDICVGFGRDNFYLMDFLGELVMVIAVYEKFLVNEVLVKNDYDAIKEFHVYKADFSVKKWVRMESIGDHTLFFSSKITFSLPAVNVGFRKNAIYSAGGLKGGGVAWRAFDMSTKGWIDGPGMQVPTCKCNSSYGRWSWFLPTLDYCNVSKMNEAWRVLSRTVPSS